MGLRFEWDAAKAKQNLRKHAVSFEEASAAFDDELSLTIPDPAHSTGEARFLLLGQSSRHRLVVVAFTEPGPNIDSIRIISARLADRGERHDYEEGQA
jgi:uncharacterized protein